MFSFHKILILKNSLAQTTLLSQPPLNLLVEFTSRALTVTLHPERNPSKTRANISLFFLFLNTKLDKNLNFARQVKRYERRKRKRQLRIINFSSINISLM